MMIFFDVDDTLYDLMGSFLRVHNELFKDRTDTPCVDLYLASRKYNKEAFDLWNQGLLTKTEEFHYRIRKSYEQYGLMLTEDELNEFRIRYRKYQDEICMPEEMQSILAMLCEHQIPLGILTNGNHQDQWKKINALHVMDYIPKDHIFVSEDLPAPKPEKEAFQYIEAQMKHLQAEENAAVKDMEEIWYIGDTFEIDIAGAQGASWRSIWFNHRHKAMPIGALPADYEVATLSELSDVLKQIIS